MGNNRARVLGLVGALAPVIYIIAVLVGGFLWQGLFAYTRHRQHTHFGGCA
ncbi:MAG: hypothetical protein ACM3UY_08245 [Methanocella sp.]